MPEYRAIVFHRFEFEAWFAYPLWLGMKLMGWNTERCHASLVVWKDNHATCYSWGENGMFNISMPELKRTFHSGFVLPHPYAPLSALQLTKRRVTPMSCLRAFLGRRDANTCVSVALMAAGEPLPIQFPDWALTVYKDCDTLVLNNAGEWHVV